MTRNNDRTQDAEATDNELEIIKVDLDEALKLAEAAQAMLAALKVAWHEMRHTTATRSSFTDALDAVDAAIAQAETAGIKATEAED